MTVAERADHSEALPANRVGSVVVSTTDISENPPEVVCRTRRLLLADDQPGGLARTSDDGATDRVS